MLPDANFRDGYKLHTFKFKFVFQTARYNRARHNTGNISHRQNKDNYNICKNNQRVKNMYK